jgi:hypothetical protein
MMDVAVDEPVRTFIEVTEVWVPKDGRLILDGGDYGELKDFAAVSGEESFAKGEGLPGKAWAEAKPIVLKEFEGSYFKRAEAAKAAGLTSAVAVPVFAGDALKAVLVVLCANDDAAKHFEWVSQHTQFPRGQGLPGGVWASGMPMLMRDLGSGYRFIRAESAGQAGLTTGLGLPVPTPGGADYVLTLLSARGTPIARRFELWDARSTTVGKEKQAVLTDGLCAREGAIWNKERRVNAWQGVIGRVLGSGVPVAASGAPGLAAGYDSIVALPIHLDGELAHIVAWYS